MSALLSQAKLLRALGQAYGQEHEKLTELLARDPGNIAAVVVAGTVSRLSRVHLNAAQALEDQAREETGDGR